MRFLGSFRSLFGTTSLHEVRFFDKIALHEVKFYINFALHKVRFDIFSYFCKKFLIWNPYLHRSKFTLS